MGEVSLNQNNILVHEDSPYHQIRLSKKRPAVNGPVQAVKEQGWVGILQDAYR
jgi:hypothetical protein